MGLEEVIWKDVVGFEGFYMVSSMGDVLSLSRPKKSKSGSYFFKVNNRIMSKKIDRYGYHAITLHNKESKHVTIHRLVAQAFIPNPENKPHVNHKNGIKTDNRLVNLEWVTASENIKHSFDVLGKKPNKTTCKPIIMKSENNENLFIFKDIVSAAAFVGGKISNISHAATGRNKTAYKLKWILA